MCWNLTECQKKIKDKGSIMKLVYKMHPKYNWLLNMGYKFSAKFPRNQSKEENRLASKIIVQIFLGLQYKKKLH